MMGREGGKGRGGGGGGGVEEKEEEEGDASLFVPNLFTLVIDLDQIE